MPRCGPSPLVSSGIASESSSIEWDPLDKTKTLAGRGLEKDGDDASVNLARVESGRVASLSQLQFSSYCTNNVQ